MILPAVRPSSEFINHERIPLSWPLRLWGETREQFLIRRAWERNRHAEGQALAVGLPKWRAFNQGMQRGYQRIGILHRRRTHPDRERYRCLQNREDE